MSKKRFTPDTIKLMNYLSMPDLHPMGDKAVFVKTAADEETGLFCPHIYELDLLTEEVKPAADLKNLTRHPLYSPAGDALAYLADTSGEYQIYVKRQGENPRQITSLRHGVVYFDWSYDGKALVFQAPLWQEEAESGLCFREMCAEERQAFREEQEWAPVEVTQIDYKSDECFGVRDGSKMYLGVAEADGSALFLLPTNEMECAFPSFSPNNQKIAFYGKPYQDAFASAAELFVYDRGKGKMIQITENRSLTLNPKVRPLFSTDGEQVYVTGFYTDETGSFVETIYQVDLRSKEANLLFVRDDRETTFGIHAMAVSRSVYGEEKPYFQIDYLNSYLYFTNAWYGRENLYRISLTGGARIEPVYTEGMNIHDFSLSENGRCVVIAGDLLHLAEVYRLDVTNGLTRRETQSNEWMEDYELAGTEEFFVPTRDGKDRIQVWLVHPIGAVAGKRYPVVLDIHGGPECTYVSDFWHEFQAFAAAGMVCVYTNPRGSSGYGASFGGFDYAWKQEAVDDLLTAIDTAVEKGLGDPSRVGITGGSYGGYMSLKMITETDVFRAAALQRCLANLATSYGTGDMGFISRENADVSGIKMLDVLTDRARRSLIRKVDQIKVPLLLLHGYKDYRCTFEQSEQVFIAMKERRPEIPVRLVMFPEENHEVTRTGNLHSQIRHLTELTDWFVKYC